MTKKEFGRFIAFALVVCLVLYMMCDLFEQYNTPNSDKRFATYRTLNENTVDAVWIGTSGVDRYWIPPKAYDEYGFTLYALSSDAMPTWLFVNVLEEVYTYQNPELIIVDMRAYAQSNTSADSIDPHARRVIDGMDFFSGNRIRTAFDTMQFMHENFEGKRFDLSYLLPYIKYHTMWQEEDYSIMQQFGNREHSYLGFYMNTTLSIQREPLEKVVHDPDNYLELNPLAEASLYDLLDYSRANNIELLFVDTPQIKTASENGREKHLIKILEEEGVNYINFCETDEAGNFIHAPNLDLENDFYNAGHTNFYGAEKFTEIFSAYLDEHYDLPDRRGDAAVQEQWDGIYGKVKQKIATWES